MTKHCRYCGAELEPDNDHKLCYSCYKALVPKQTRINERLQSYGQSDQHRELETRRRKHRRQKRREATT